MNTTDTLNAFNNMFEGSQASDESVLGRKVVAYGVAILSNCIAMTIAYCACSTFWLGFLAYSVIALILGLIACAALIYINLNVADEKFEDLGRSVGNAAATVRGWFTKA